MARKPDAERWMVAELSIKVPALTPAGRDVLVTWLQERARALAAFKCENEYSWNQPARRYKLKVGY